jgi:AbrB family looped-hinge helix DNA binding protein
MNISVLLTDNGQITLPKEVQEYLFASPGDPLEFVVGTDGRVVLRRAKTIDVRELRGILKREGQPPVSLEEMREAIIRGANREVEPV